MKAIIGGEEHAAELTTEHSSSSYGQPVLVVEGQAYGTGDAWPELQVSDEEWKALYKAGYFVRKEADYTATDDGGCDEHIVAESMEDACRQAEEWIRDADCWGREPTTQYVACIVRKDGSGDAEWITVAIDPEEPQCPDGDAHDWQPAEGGCDENPGVWGSGGGVIIGEVCSHCDMRKTTDTWAQNPDTGEQGLTSVSYV